jgi:cellulose synthase/poly-beta-1,6-N-acetylglucosamine synthase-like glycosyltransferase
MPLSQISFWIFGLFGLYVVLFYPLLLAWMAAKWPKPVARAPRFPYVSVVIATHNGAAFLKEKLDSIFALEYPLEKIQVIVVNDGSTDSTGSIAKCYGRGVILLDIDKSGKSAALNRGIAVSKGEILVLTDVRQRLAPDSLRFLMENFADLRVGAVSGELQIEAGDSSSQQSIGAYWRYERWIRVNLSAIDSIFGATGSYYALRRELAVPIPANTLLDDMYLPLNAFFRGFRLIVDRRAQMFDYPTSLSTEFGRKVRTLAGNYQILRAYPQLLGPGNRLWFHFVSYKFARLFLPFAFLVAAVSGLIAGGSFAIFSAVIQVVAYSAALLDPAIREGRVIKKLTSPIRAFAVMMLATICAVSIWFVPPERLWRTTRVVRRDLAA